MKTNNSRPSWLTRLGVACLVSLAVVVGIALSVVVFALLLGGGLLISGWLWWQMRRLRRESAQTDDFLEAEYQVETEYKRLEIHHPSDNNRANSN